MLKKKLSIVFQSIHFCFCFHFDACHDAVDETTSHRDTRLYPVNPEHNDKHCGAIACRVRHRLINSASWRLAWPVTMDTLFLPNNTNYDTRSNLRVSKTVIAP